MNEQLSNIIARVKVTPGRIISAIEFAIFTKVTMPRLRRWYLSGDTAGGYIHEVPDRDRTGEE